MHRLAVRTPGSNPGDQGSNPCASATYVADVNGELVQVT